MKPRRPADATDGELGDILAGQLAAWEAKPALRSLYHGWFREIADALVPGPTVEIGAGIGRLREVVPGIAALDLEPTPWTDVVGDAQQLPFRDGSLAGLVLFDVLHHIPRPSLFFRQAQQALAPGGRIVVMDPYVSPLSGFVYRRFHPEPVDMSVDPLVDRCCGKEAFDSNQAVATCLFHRGADRWEAAFPDLRVILRKRCAMFAYPATGGFGGRSLLPDWLVKAIAAVEPALSFLTPLCAFRTLIALEKTT